MARPLQQKFIVQPGSDGERLDRALATGCPGLSRGEARRLIAAGVVFVAGKRSGICSRLVRAGEAISWQTPARLDPRPSDDRSAGEPGVRVVIERPGFWILDKPAGMPVEPTRSGTVGTLVDVVFRHFAETPYVTHRLDAATSGLLIVARRPAIQAELNRLFAAHEVARRYLAIVALDGPAGPASSALSHALWETGAVSIDRPLDGRAAITHLSVVERSAVAATLAVRLETGRTRQIRRHLADLGCPVVGESPSGQRSGGRLMLHAYQLNLPPSFSGGAIEATAPLPDDFRARMTALALSPDLPAPR